MSALLLPLKTRCHSCFPRGSQFGSEDTDPPPLIEVYYFWTSSAGVEVQFAAEDCRITDAHREIRCAYTAGVGGNLRWQVRISNQSSDTPTTRYASPVITSAAAVRGPNNTNVTHSMSGQPEELAVSFVNGGCVNGNGFTRNWLIPTEINRNGL